MAQELKAFKQGSVELGEYWAYDAEEVDAVLAEKDAFIKTLGEGQAELACEIERLKTKLEDVLAKLEEQESEKLHDKAIQACCDADKVIRHQKYKRCLAMAKYCYTNVHCIMGHRLCALSVRKKEWFDRWRKRWLELSEKFKEEK